MEKEQETFFSIISRVLYTIWADQYSLKAPIYLIMDLINGMFMFTLCSVLMACERKTSNVDSNMYWAEDEAGGAKLS